MVNLRKILDSQLPLSITQVVKTLRDLSNKVVIEKSILDEIALMPSGSDITSLLGVTELTEIAECIKLRGSILIEYDTDLNLVGGIYSPIETWTLYNPTTDVSVAIAWIDKSGSSVIYHRLEMYVDFASNKVILSDAPYKAL